MTNHATPTTPNATGARSVFPRLVASVDIEADHAEIRLEAFSSEDEAALIRWLQTHPRAIAQLERDLHEVIERIAA